MTIKKTLKYQSNVDKIDGFIYYTFEITKDIKIIISKFDGKEWKIANKIVNSDLAIKLGEIIDNEK